MVFNLQRKGGGGFRYPGLRRARLWRHRRGKGMLRWKLVIKNNDNRDQKNAPRKSDVQRVEKGRAGIVQDSNKRTERGRGSENGRIKKG